MMKRKIVRRVSWFVVAVVVAISSLWFWLIQIERPKLEYAELQSVQSNTVLSDAEDYRLVLSREMKVLLLKGGEGESVAILLNPKSEPYLKQVPANAKFTLTEEVFREIKKDANLHEEVQKVLEMKVTSDVEGKSAMRTKSKRQHAQNFIVIDPLNQENSHGVEVTERLVQLLNPRESRLEDPSVFVTDVGTGEVFKISNFRGVLGVRSTNEKFYLLRLDSDYRLHGIDPVYQATEGFDKAQNEFAKKNTKKALGKAELYWLMNRACSNGDLIGVRMLLRAGADVDGLSDYDAFVNDGGGFEPSWPINLAASGGHFEIVVELLKHGARVNNPEGDGGSYNALTFAVMNGHVDVVELLVNEGADNTLRCYEGSILDIAKKSGSQRMIKLLEGE